MSQGPSTSIPVDIEVCDPGPTHSSMCKPSWVSKRNQYTDVLNFEEMVKFKRHSAHVVLWSHGRGTDLILGKFELKHRVLMQIRYDGSFGLPGGFIDVARDGHPTTTSDLFEAIKAGLKRKVNEEMAMELDFNPRYVYTSVSPSDEPKKFMCHTFVAEVSMRTLDVIEESLANIVTSLKVLGITRVPLYILPEGFKAQGLPTFLAGRFSGNALEQLLRVCLSEEFLTERQVVTSLRLASHIVGNR